jgi:hypothetical protein
MNGVHQSPHFDVSYSLTTTSADVVAFLLSKRNLARMAAIQQRVVFARI